MKNKAHSSRQAATPSSSAAVPAKEVARRFAHYQERAEREPVVIAREGRARVVMIPIAEYRRLKRRDRIAMRVEDLPDEIVAALAKARAPAEAAAYDHEVE